MWPSSLLIVRFGRRGRVSIPVPLFILWPVALVVALIGWIATGAAAVCKADWMRLVACGARATGLIWRARGLTVVVRGEDGRVSVRFI